MPPTFAIFLLMGELFGSLSADTQTAKSNQSLFLENPLQKSILWCILPVPRRGDRAAEGARLEIVCTERYRGFESLPLRHVFLRPQCEFAVRSDSRVPRNGRS